MSLLVHVCSTNTESSAEGVQDEEKVYTLEAAEPTAAISEMALPSEPALASRAGPS